MASEPPRNRHRRACKIAAKRLPLNPSHAFDMLLGRTLRALDTDGLIDARTALLYTRRLRDAIFSGRHQQIGAIRGGGFVVCGALWPSIRASRPIDGSHDQSAA